MNIAEKLISADSGVSVIVNACKSPFGEYSEEVANHGWSVYVGRQKLTGYVSWRGDGNLKRDAWGGDEWFGNYFAAGPESEIGDRNLEQGAHRIDLVTDEEIIEYFRQLKESISGDEHARRAIADALSEYDAGVTAKIKFLASQHGLPLCL